MTATERYITVLEKQKPGILGLLRKHAGLGLDESVHAFDLFAALWWPLRQRNEHAPRREVAWLVTKLYAWRPMRQARGRTLAAQLSFCRPSDETARNRFQQRFDRMLYLPLRQMETPLRWALNVIAERYEDPEFDWVQLTNDLSKWERESTRIVWAEQFLGIKKGK